MPQKVIILDSSQISTWLDCPCKWDLSYRQRLTHSNKVEEALSAGTLMHKLIELFHTNGNSVQKALDFKMPEGFPLTDKTAADVRKRFQEYVLFWMAQGQSYVIATRPRYAVKIENSLPVDFYEQELLVEQGFSFHLYEDKDYLFVLEGRIDAIVEMSGNKFWVDHKLQFRERELYKKSIQFRNYALATGFSLGMIDYIRMQKEIGPKTFIRQVISFNAYEQRMWKIELINIFKDIADSGIAPPMQRWNSCDGKFGYPCEFVSLCEEWNPQTKLAIVQRDFVKREEWKPW
jgi:hypothetical protein